MTIVDSSAPLVVVVGATGNQGGSVVKALSESSAQYRIRGLSRDASKPAAKQLSEQGVEMVSANIEDRSAIDEAFKGADIVFAVTDFWAHLNKEKEVNDGKRLVDAAKAAGVDLFVYSGLPSFSKISSGKYTHVDHFDGKADVTQYALSTFGKDHFKSVQAASYMQNFSSLLAPRKTEHGYIMAYPAPVEGKIGLIDLNGDYGLFVVAAIEHRKETDTEIPACADEPTFVEAGKTIGQAQSKEIMTVEASREQFEDATGEMPQSAKDDLREMLLSISEFGYFGNADWRKAHQYLSRKPKTLAEWAKTADFPTLQ